MARRRSDHGHGEAEATRRALSAAGWRSGRSAAAPRRRPGLPPCSPALLAAARGSVPRLYSRRARRGRREGSAGIPPPSQWRGSPAMRRRARIRPAAALRAQGRRGGGGTRPRPPWHGAGEAGPPLRVAGERGREEGGRRAGEPHRALLPARAGPWTELKGASPLAAVVPARKELRPRRHRGQPCLTGPTSPRPPRRASAPPCSPWPPPCAHARHGHAASPHPQAPRSSSRREGPPGRCARRRRR